MDTILTDPPVPLPSRLAVGELARASVSAVSSAIASLSPGLGRPLPLDADQVAAAYGSERHLRLDGAGISGFAPLSGFWPTADGWVRTHGNYPHHATALCEALGLPASAARDDVSDALRAREAAPAASAVREAGGVCVLVSREDPAADAALRRHPLTEVSPLADSRPRRIPGAEESAPLAGVRVLDLTRVIAGPVATRTLAFAGADVLRLDPPQRPEIPWQHLDTGHGKRSALLDIAADRPRFDALLADADVVVLGYRPDGLRRLGLEPRTLAAVHPQLIVAQLSAWHGAYSPRGFDSIVQADCGISWIESSDGRTPGALPAQALDHSAGYLLAAGIMTALRRRGEAGGSWYVRTSLRRVAAELLGMRRTPTAAPMPAAAARTQEFDVAGTRVTTVAPAVRWQGGPEMFRAPRPWGGDAAEWW
ncbi:CoA transferase [Microbacterium soli]